MLSVMILLATIGGILAMIFSGIGGYLVSKSGKPYLTVFIIRLPGLIIFLPVVLWYGLGASFDIALAFVGIASFFFFVAYVLYVKALVIGPVGVAAPISTLYPLVTLLLGVLFFGAVFSMMQFIALIVIMTGTALLAFDLTDLKQGMLSRKTIYLAGVAAFLWGAGFIFIEFIIDEYAWFQLIFLIGIIAAFFSFFLIRVKHQKFPRMSELIHRDTKFAWWAGLSLTTGAIAFFWVAEQTGSIIIPAVIAAGSPIITGFLASRFDNEKLSFFKKVGVVVLLAGIVLLNL